METRLDLCGKASDEMPKHWKISREKVTKRLGEDEKGERVVDDKLWRCRRKGRLAASASGRERVVRDTHGEGDVW